VVTVFRSCDQALPQTVASSSNRRPARSPRRGDLGDHQWDCAVGPFRRRSARPADVAAGILGAVVKDPVADRVAWSEYLEVVARDREGWSEFYTACRDVS
jgi:hypothetical protein